jgi:hypothetical protein
MSIAGKFDLRLAPIDKDGVVSGERVPSEAASAAP